MATQRRAASTSPPLSRRRSAWPSCRAARARRPESDGAMAVRAVSRRQARSVLCRSQADAEAERDTMRRTTSAPQFTVSRLLAPCAISTQAQRSASSDGDGTSSPPICFASVPTVVAGVGFVALLFLGDMLVNLATAVASSFVTYAVVHNHHMTMFLCLGSPLL